MKHKRNDIKVGHVVLRHQRDVFAPPPPGKAIHSPFETIHDWLCAICDAEPPAGPISIYSFGVFESPDEWLLFVVGENKTQQDQYTSATHIDFKPSYMYFLLPAAQHLGKPGNEVRARLRRELETFTRTEKFQSSFLATADRAEWNGEGFWHR
jgi:hypothetical protein